MSVAISILVPVYNVESFLQRCLDSVVFQSFHDWEMIIVDDGSTDNSPYICDKAAHSDKRIRVIHKINGGLPSARLAAFKEAKGEWVMFLDSDDWLLDDALQILFDAATSNGSYDVVKSMVHRVDDTGEEWDETYDFDNGELNGEGVFLQNIMRDSIAPYVHSAIYRKSLFTEEVFEIIIRNGVSIGEDWFVNVAIGGRVNRALFISKPTYAYFTNRKSMMGSSVYGWEYYDRIERCKHEINRYIGFAESDEYKCRKALVDLRYFFFPEVPFSWKHYKEIQPLAIRGLEYQKKEYSCYRKRFCRFISHPWIYWLYTLIFRYLFLIFKLHGKKRKVVR